MTGYMARAETCEWSTPSAVFDPLQQEFGPFDLDPAAADWNAKAPSYYTIETRGERSPWFGKVWLNPPYGDDVKVFLRHGVQYLDSGACSLIVALLPVRTAPVWFHDLVRPRAAEIRFWRGRIRFLRLPGSLCKTCEQKRKQTCTCSAPFPSMVVVMRAGAAPGTKTGQTRLGV